MADRQKAIEAFIRCGTPGACSDKCAYFSEGFNCYRAMKHDLLELLKEQEPRRLKVTENAYGRKFYFCPRCARPIEKSAVIGKPRHCEDCGQELIWE